MEFNINQNTKLYFADISEPLTASIEKITLDINDKKIQILYSLN